MTEKFESKFHKQYVGGQGEVEEMTRPILEIKVGANVTTLEEVLFEYRKHVKNSKAELPKAVMDTFLAIQRTENDRN